MLGIKGFIPKADRTKPPLTPIWAVRFSLAAVLGGLVLVFVANRWLYVPLKTAFLIYLGCAYLTVALSWASLELRTYNWAIRGHNLFIYSAFCLFLMVMLIQDSYEAFPTWATIGLFGVGGFGYSVAGICGFRNFIKWGRGGYRKMANSTT